MEDTLTHAKRQKELAKHYKNTAARTSGEQRDERSVARLEKALSLLQEALDILLPRYKEVTSGGPLHTELSRELADCYGIMGGIYRRRAILEG